MARTQVNSTLRRLGLTLYFDENSVSVQRENSAKREVLITVENEDKVSFYSQVIRNMLPMGAIDKMAKQNKK